MRLEIISPEKTLYSGEVESVTLPGTAGSFTILKDHAPIISVLDKGKLVYRNSAGETELAIDGGFVEMKQNTVEVCVD
jgi:F-type H+-transporting ATPase subunit epsilon